MRLIALLALAVVTCGCVVYQCPSTPNTSDALKLDGDSGVEQAECPPSKRFTGTCTDGCNTWTCDGSGMCMVTSLYCPSTFDLEITP